LFTEKDGSDKIVWDKTDFVFAGSAAPEIFDVFGSVRKLILNSTAILFLIQN
jgi:hypothetical protein